MHPMSGLNQHNYQLFSHYQTEHGMAPQRVDAGRWSRRLLRLLVAGALLLTVPRQPMHSNREGDRFSLAGVSGDLIKSVGSEPLRLLGATWVQQPSTPIMPVQPPASMAVITVAPAGDGRARVFLPLVEQVETPHRVLPSHVPATPHTTTTCEERSGADVQTTVSSRAARRADQPVAHALVGDIVVLPLVANAIGFNVSLARYHTSRPLLAQAPQAVPAPAFNAIFLPLVTNRSGHDIF